MSEVIRLHLPLFSHQLMSLRDSHTQFLETKRPRCAKKSETPPYECWMTAR